MKYLKDESLGYTLHYTNRMAMAILQDRIKQHKDETIVNKQRKLSLTILLNDKNEYDGGELEFDFKNRPENNIRVCDEIKTQGSIVIFPSFVWHRIKPVISGTRYSLVVWTLGEPWK